MVNKASEHFPTISKGQVTELLTTIENAFNDWDKRGGNSAELKELITQNVDSYQLIQNSSTQSELDMMVDRYTWIYPFFKFMENIPTN